MAAFSALGLSGGAPTAPQSQALESTTVARTVRTVTLTATLYSRCTFFDPGDSDRADGTWVLELVGPRTASGNRQRETDCDTSEKPVDRARYRLFRDWDGGLLRREVGLLLVGVATLVGCLVLPVGVKGHARGAPLTVAVAELSGTSRATEEALRTAVTTNLASVRGYRIGPLRDADLVLRGGVKTHRYGQGDGRGVRCEVSIVLADRRGGRIKMILSGKARAQGGFDDVLASAAVRAAVKGAFAPLLARPRSLVRGRDAS